MEDGEKLHIIAKPEEPNYGSTSTSITEEPQTEDDEHLVQQIERSGEPKHDSTEEPGPPPGNRYTVQQALDHFGLGHGNLLAIGSAFFSNFAGGSEMMILPIILPKLRCEWELSAFSTVLIPIITTFTAVLGSGLVTVLSGTFGRLSIITTGMFLSFFVAIMSTFSQNIWHFILFRAMLALPMEMSTCMSHVYVIEMCPKNNRALMVSANFAFWSVGSIASAILSYFLLEWFGWRIILLLLALPTIICAGILLFQRESPFYDVACGKLKDTQKTLDFICEHNKKEPLPGKVKKHEGVENPRSFEVFDTVLSKSFKIESFIIFFTIAVAFLHMGFTSWATPRIADEGEGWCNKTIEKHTHEKVCHRYSEESLRSLLIGTTGEIFGNTIFYLITHLGGRLPSIRVASVGSTLVITAMLFCGGMIKITTDIFLIRLVHSGMFVTLLVYLNEYYPTHMRGIASAFGFSAGRLFSLLVIIPAVLIDIEDMDLLIFGIVAASFITIIGSFVLVKETKDVDLI